ncbi:hypothetical protein VTK26DRAFT_1853 [Humicola hyalothermophila]
MSQPKGRKPAQREVPDYKAKLDEAASRAKSPPTEDQDSTTRFKDKVAQYAPAPISKMLGASQAEGPDPSPPPESREIPGPPDRPIHDTQIAEFIKDQHRSKDLGIMPDKK